MDQNIVSTSPVPFEAENSSIVVSVLGASSANALGWGSTKNGQLARSPDGYLSATNQSVDPSRIAARSRRRRRILLNSPVPLSVLRPSAVKNGEDGEENDYEEECIVDTSDNGGAFPVSRATPVVSAACGANHTMMLYGSSQLNCKN